MDTYYWYIGIGTIIFVAAAFVADVMIQSNTQRYPLSFRYRLYQ